MSENAKTLIGVLTGTAGTAVSATINDVLGIVLTAINIVYLAVLIIIRIISKIKEARENDGVIDADEAAGIAGEIKTGIEQITEKIEEVKKDGK